MWSNDVYIFTERFIREEEAIERLTVLDMQGGGEGGDLKDSCLHLTKSRCHMGLFVQ